MYIVVGKKVKDCWGKKRRCGENEKRRKRIKRMNECSQWRIKGVKEVIPPAPPLSSSPKWYGMVT